MILQNCWWLLCNFLIEERMIHSDICTSCLRLDYFWNTFNPCPNSVRPFTLCKLMSPWWKSCSGEGFFHSWESLTNDLDSWLRLNLCNLGTDVNCCLSSQARIAHWEQGLGNLTARLTGLSWGHWCLTVCSSWLDPTFLGFGGWQPFPQHGMMHRQGEDKQFAVPPEARRLALMKLECSSPPKQLMRLLRIVDFA